MFVTVVANLVGALVRPPKSVALGVGHLQQKAPLQTGRTTTEILVVPALGKVEKKQTKRC